MHDTPGLSRPGVSFMMRHSDARGLATDQSSNSTLVLQEPIGMSPQRTSLDRDADGHSIQDEELGVARRWQRRKAAHGFDR